MPHLTMIIDQRLQRIAAAQPYPRLFATISGEHLYGSLSPDSDYDLRGAHMLPLDALVGLEVRDETVEQTMRVAPHAGPLRREAGISPQPSPGLRPPSPAPAGEGHGGEGALEMDIVSHDVKKFFGLLRKKNGYVLEQLYSPLIVHTTPEHAELKAICNPRQNGTIPHPRPVSHRMGEGGRRPGEGVLTKHHSHHYFGFAETQWKLFLKGEADEEAGTSCRSSEIVAAQPAPYTHLVCDLAEPSASEASPGGAQCL